MQVPSQYIRTEADRQAIAKGCYWSQKHADAIITFTEAIFKPKQLARPGKFRLMTWQTQFLQSLYGWRNPNGTRRFRFANLHIAKKNGKTMLVAAISAFELLAAGEQSPFVVTGSASKDNAGQVFAEITHTLAKTGLAKFCEITKNQKKIVVPSLHAEYRSLASDGDRVQGYNCSLVILDECHAHKSSSLYDSLRYATRSRPNGLILCISTAGLDPTCYYHTVYLKSKRILAGEDLDQLHYAEVYESHPDTDPEDPVEWAKANPALGEAFSEEVFRGELEGAKGDPVEWRRFVRYSLNRWLRSDDMPYFDLSLWDKLRRDIPDEELQQLECWLGVDLSLTTDPSSVTAVWVLPGRRFHFRSWAWVARAGVKYREATNLPRYEEFEAADPNFRITEGDRIDNDLIENFVLSLCQQHRVRQVTFDPTSAVVMMGRIQDQGYEVKSLAQTHRHYNGPMRALHKAVAENAVSHDGGNWLRYCMGCVRVAENDYGEIRPHTKRSIDHIDGAIAGLMAYSEALQDREGSGLAALFI